MIQLSYNKWPDWLKHPIVQDIYIYDCPVWRGCFKDWHETAHCHPKSAPLPHTICFRNKQVLNTKYVGLHELAHLISDRNHDDRWRKCVLGLGGTLKEKKYQQNYEK